MTNIWNNLKKPFFVLAPMEDVTDTVFRQIIADCGKPDLFFTEFVSVDGIFSNGKEKVIRRLRFTKKEKPIIAQIWGKKPDNYLKAGTLLKEMGFDGIDINMGCPVKKVIKQGCCSALINNQTLAEEIIIATKEGSCGLPVSIKTRIGFKSIVTENWLSFLLKFQLAALTVHGRIATQNSDGINNWDEIGKAVGLRNKISPKTLIIGNGDVFSKKEGRKIAKNFELDGIMIGRGVFQNPYIFEGNIQFFDISTEEKLELLHRHVKLYLETWGERGNFQVLKKFFKIYVNGFEGAVDLRSKLMETSDLNEVETMLESYKKAL